MLIIHISDIHFRKGEAGFAMDPNHNLRSELVRDAKEQCEELRLIPDAVLVSGDIAYAGDPEEYKFAATWFEELCLACGCERSTLFVIPGNHDVQRKLAGKPLVQTVHNDIKGSESHLLNTKLTAFLEDEDTRNQLYAPLKNFNDFAGQYFCDLLPPHRTKIKRDFNLDDGSTLRITGLNSAFVSSAADVERSLFVDPASFTITREDGVTHLVLCHHPYNWLKNGQLLADHLNVVSHIQLFGHDHTNRIELNRDWVKIAASAAHPEPTERGYEPGYNLIQLSVETNGEARHLAVNTHVRIWQERPGQFVPKMDKKSTTFAHTIALEPWRVPGLPVEVDLDNQLDNQSATSMHAQTTEENTSMMSLRALSIRFFKLNFSQRLAIAGGLSLFEDDDTKLPDHERFRQVLLRARERDLLEQLGKEIAQFERSEASTETKEN